MLELMKASGVNMGNSGIDPTALGNDSLQFLQQKMQQFRRPKARRHEEVDDEEEARRQEELALRDFFTAQAAQQRKDQVFFSLCFKCVDVDDDSKRFNVFSV
jgi:hypothetical protein